MQINFLKMSLNNYKDLKSRSTFHHLKLRNENNELELKNKTLIKWWDFELCQIIQQQTKLYAN